MSKPYLIADIGGTNARFCLAELDASEDSVRLFERKDYKAKEFDRLEDALNDYLGGISEPSLKDACFAVAGPINDRVVDFTNSAWMLDGNKLEKSLSLDRMMVVNDFRAMTYGSLFVPSDELIQVKEGTIRRDCPRAVLGPGTGLGLGLIVPDEQGYHVVATEGGHVSFSPRTDRQIAVLEHLTRMFGHVSFERVVSGMGILNTYRALSAIEDERCTLETPEEVTIAALEHNDQLAEETLNFFCEVLGIYAGNVVLATGSRGGVSLAGGILPKIQDFFLESRFRQAFADKSPMDSYFDNIPVQLIVSPNTALIGAAKLLKDFGQ